MTFIERTFEPAANAARAYDRILPRYKSLYGAMKNWREAADVAEEQNDDV